MDFAERFKQALKLQESMKKLHEELSQKTVKAQAGAGMVSVVVSGDLQLVSLTIDKEIINSADMGMLNDLVVSAVNEGLRRAKDLVSTEMRGIAGGIAGIPNIPGLS